MHLIVVLTIVSAIGIIAVGLLITLFIKQRSLLQKTQSLEKNLQKKEVLYFDLQKQLQAKKEQKETKENKKSKESVQNKNSEILSLRKEKESIKEELKKAKLEIKEQLKILEQYKEDEEGRLFHLKQENQSLLSQIKESHEIILEYKKAISSQSTKPLEERISKLEEDKKQMEKDFQNKENYISKLQNILEENKKQLQETQKELQTWTHTALDFQGKPLDTKTYLKWKYRAIVAKELYQKMRDLREMTDLKLKTYQDSILCICNYILKDQVSREQNKHVDESLQQALEYIRSQKEQECE